MPDTQDTLLEEFQQIEGAIADSTEAWSTGGSQGSGQGRSTAPRGNVDANGDQTGSIDHGSSSATSDSNASGGSLSGIESTLASGLGIIPLGLEIASLFEGGPAAPPTLTNYAMPDSIGFVGSTDDTGAATDADFGQMGQPRSYGTPSTPAGTAAPAQGSQPSGSSQGQPIQITVQALDAQSIMDRSDDIASAVNKAILALHPITDTISNL
jgi:hypothetical protein